MPPTVETKAESAVVADVDFHWLKEARCVAEQTTDHEIVVDISAVGQIRSSELNQLIRLHLDVKQQGRVLVLENAQHQLWEIFTLTRLNRLLEFRNPQDK